MLTLTAVRRFIQDPVNLGIFSLAFLAAISLGFSITMSLFTVATPPTFTVTGQVHETNAASPAGATNPATLDITATATQQASDRRTAVGMLQAGLVSFGLLAAVLYTAAAVKSEDQPAITRAAEKITLGLLVLFPPIVIEWIVALYITPPVSWSWPWLIPLLLFVTAIMTCFL